MNTKAISDSVAVMPQWAAMRREGFPKNPSNDKHILNNLANFTTPSLHLNHQLN